MISSKAVKTPKVESFSKWAPLFVIAAAVLFRLIGISRPLLGNFAVYQIAQATMARFFAEDHFKNFLYPTVSFLVAGKPSLLILYYPISSFIAAVCQTFLGGSLDLWGRLQAVVFFAASAWLLFRVVQEFLSREEAWLSLLLFVMMPLTIIYGQSFQNEMITVFASLLFVQGSVAVLKKGNLEGYLTGALGWALVMLTRPNCLYLMLPVFYLALWGFQKTPGSLKQAFKIVRVLAIGSIVPALWYLHAWNVSAHADNIYSTLFAQLESRSAFVPKMIFTSKYYVELFDILSGITLTPFGMTLFIIGVFVSFQNFKTHNFFLLWSFIFLGSSLLIARKLIDHNLYLLHFVLPAVPVLAVGLNTIRQNFSESMKKVFTVFFFAIFFVVSMRYSFNPAFVTPEASKNTFKAAEALKLHTAKNSKIVEASPDSMSLLYYAERLGWCFFFQDNRAVPYHWKTKRFAGMSIEERDARNKAYEKSVDWIEYLRVKEGADYFIATPVSDYAKDKEFSAYMETHYTKISKPTDPFVLFDLRAPASMTLEGSIS